MLKLCTASLSNQRLQIKHAHTHHFCLYKFEKIQPSTSCCELLSHVFVKVGPLDHRITLIQMILLLVLSSVIKNMGLLHVFWCIYYFSVENLQQKTSWHACAPTPDNAARTHRDFINFAFKHQHLLLSTWHWKVHCLHDFPEITCRSILLAYALSVIGLNLCSHCIWEDSAVLQCSGSRYNT